MTDFWVSAHKNQMQTQPFDKPQFSSDALESFLNLGDVAACLVNDKGEILWLSDLMIEWFGIDYEDIVHIKWRDIIQCEGDTLWDDNLEAQYLEKTYWKGEGPCDSVIKGRMFIEIIMIAQKEGQRLITIRDITQDKRNADEILEEKNNAEYLNRRLETEIAKANSLTVAANRANIAKSVFLTSMSHEFRTPLNGILGYSQILLKDKELNDKNKLAASTIDKCGRHLLSLINDVLDLSRIESGKVIYRPQEMDLRNLIQEVVDVFKVRAESKDLELSSYFEYLNVQCDWFEADEKLIRQILINLVGNAIKFTDSGSIQMKMCVDCKSVDQDFWSVELSVEDTGAGISNEDLSNIFEEFYQVEAFSGHKGGTGLGLAICRKLAKTINSQLQVESELQKGSRFWFKLELRPVRTQIQHSSCTLAVTEDNPGAQSKSDRIPQEAILSAMLFDANMGDLRSLETKLEHWEHEQSVKSVFEETLRNYLSAYKTDRICEYLNQCLASEN